jgi:segregation and condensation protein A
MKTTEHNIFALDNFEGPLDFLLHLIQKNEIDIYDVSIKRITDQYLTKLHEFTEFNVDNGAEFIGAAASLLLLKSKSLLPKHEQQMETPEDTEPDPRFEIIHQLIEYCRFKDLAKTLSEREAGQGAFFGRGVDSPEPKKFLGIEHLSISDLASLFQHVLSKASPNRGNIHEDEWRVSDKIAYIKGLGNEIHKIPFVILFTAEQCKEELIVTFLAILELMKMGDVCIIRESATQEVFIISNKRLTNA